jgi:hypothetical protein
VIIGQLERRQGPEFCYQVFESNGLPWTHVIRRSFKHCETSQMHYLMAAKSVNGVNR